VTHLLLPGRVWGVSVVCHFKSHRAPPDTSIVLAPGVTPCLPPPPHEPQGSHPPEPPSVLP